jgi:hypothetical protein
MNHPIPFRTHGFERSKVEIDRGIEAVAAALGDAKSLAPFFRFPGLGRTEAVEDYLGERGLMIWSADFPADDWRRISANTIVERALRRLEAKGKGILLLHDIQPATVLALPTILSELKARGYRIVHVQPAAAGRPKTVTATQDWLPRDRPRMGFPQIALGDVQNLSGDFLLDRSAESLCALALAQRQPRIRHARHRRRPVTNHIAVTPNATPDIHTMY